MKRRAYDDGIVDLQRYGGERSDRKIEWIEQDICARFDLANSLFVGKRDALAMVEELDL